MSFQASQSSSIPFQFRSGVRPSDPSRDPSVLSGYRGCDPKDWATSLADLNSARRSNTFSSRAVNKSRDLIGARIISYRAPKLMSKVSTNLPAIVSPNYFRLLNTIILCIDFHRVFNGGIFNGYGVDGVTHANCLAERFLVNVPASCVA